MDYRTDRVEAAFEQARRETPSAPVARIRHRYNVYRDVFGARRLEFQNDDGKMFDSSECFDTYEDS
jgi:hypothetical protein